MTEVRAMAVIGAGQMGRGIAQVAAQIGLEVLLKDESEKLASEGRARIEQQLTGRVEAGKMTAADRDAVLSKIRPIARFEDAAGVDFVVEAVPENLELKTSTFRALDDAVNPKAILASNTSSIPLTKIAAATRRPEQVIGMHFFNPVPVMKLVEIIRALQTSESTYRTTRALAERMGKTVIASKDAPGFIVNRMLIPLLNEACFALQEGIATAEDIDAGAKLGLNHPMGPLELADFVGLDTCLYIADVLHRELGEDKYRPATLLRNYVAAGWHGRKTGRGFYVYTR